jgi:midasin
MGEGTGKKDVSDQLTDEDQLLGAQQKDQQQQQEEQGQGEDESAQGVEMEADFDGSLHDIDDRKQQQGEGDSEEEQEGDDDRIEQQMGEVSDGLGERRGAGSAGSCVVCVGGWGRGGVRVLGGECCVGL